MIFKLFARLICLALGLGSGWYVYINLAELFSGWVPMAAAAFVVLFVFSIFYFPLARHIADFLSDRMSVAFHRGKHIKAGSGLDSIPGPQKSINCTVCGGPDGPICPKCDERMSTPPNRFV